MNRLFEVELVCLLFNSIILGFVFFLGSFGRFKVKDKGGVEDIKIYF